MPWIQNVALVDIPKGHHFDAGDNSMLIQIVNAPQDLPIPKHKFKETHQFCFLDVEQDHQSDDPTEKCSQEQADELVRLLKHALENRMQVVVHCHAGICRSGAVAEIGVMMGFDDTEVFRSPNLLVKHLMMRSLGWLYDEQEPHSINGEPVQEDWINDNEKVFMLAAARRERRLKEQND